LEVQVRLVLELPLVPPLVLPPLNLPLAKCW
jgi:hypothetical protein